MKNIFLYIITATALMSFPQFSYCQTIAAINPNAIVSATGTITFKDGNLQFTGNTDGHANFDAALAEIKVADAAPVATTKAEHCPVGGPCYDASVNNENFEARELYPFSATLIAQPSSMDGAAPAKTIISIIMDGKSYTAQDGSAFDEIIQLELTLVEPMTPDPILYSVSLQHNSTVYSMVKGDASNLTITDFTWSPDRKSFNVSLDFNCAMRSWDYAFTGKGEVNLKGKMSKIHVTVPGWITTCL